jgi:hypothetical protein
MGKRPKASEVVLLGGNNYKEAPGTLRIIGVLHICKNDQK